MSTIENYNYKIFSRFSEKWFYLWKEKEKNSAPLCFQPNCEPMATENWTFSCNEKGWATLKSFTLYYHQESYNANLFLWLNDIDEDLYLKVGLTSNEQFQIIAAFVVRYFHFLGVWIFDNCSKTR